MRGGGRAEGSGGGGTGPAASAGGRRGGQPARAAGLGLPSATVRSKKISEISPKSTLLRQPPYPGLLSIGS